jgi:hypothetical protein
MSDNDIRRSDTPIFDRLAAERGYERLVDPKVYRSPFDRFIPVTPAPVEEQKPSLTLHVTNLGVTAKEALENAQAGAERLRQVMAPGMWMANPVPTVTAPREVFVMEVVHPEDAEEKYGSFAGFLEHFAAEFKKKFPNVENAAVSTSQNLDGTVTASASGTRKRGWTITDWAEEKYSEAVQSMRETYGGEQLSADTIRADFYEGTTQTPGQIYESMVGAYVKNKQEIQELVRRKAGVRFDKNDTDPQFRFMPPVETEGGPTMEDYSNFVYSFVDDATKEFREKNPNALVTAVEPKGNPDGTVSMVIHAVEPVLGANHVKDLPAQQLELYRQAVQKSEKDHVLSENEIKEEYGLRGPWGFGVLPNVVPLPLRISDEEIAEQE